MFINTESHTESHRNTQHVNMCNKIHQKHQITFSNFTFFKTPSLQKLDIQNHQRIMRTLNSTIYISLNIYAGPPLFLS